MSFSRHAGKAPTPLTGGSLAAPVANGTLSAWTVDQNSGNVTYLTSVGFTGSSITYTLQVGATGLTINSGTGRITADTFTTALQSATALTIRATNATGFADQALSFTVAFVARRRPVMRQFIAVQRASSW